MIKPIETIYNGYQFRSRLEARWAVFFDKVGIPYEYEPQGFIFEDGTKYLPDFYLPWFNAYVEIKANREEEIANGIKKLAIMFESKKCTVLLCVGDPANNDMRTFCYEIDDGGGGGPCGYPARFLEGVAWKEGCPEEEVETTKHHILLAVGYTGDRIRDYYDCEWELLKSSVSMQRVIRYRSDFDYAKQYARQARFEHGEAPKIERRN